MLYIAQLKASKVAKACENSFSVIFDGVCDSEALEILVNHFYGCINNFLAVLADM